MKWLSLLTEHAQEKGLDALAFMELPLDQPIGGRLSASGPCSNCVKSDGLMIVQLYRGHPTSALKTWQYTMNRVSELDSKACLILWGIGGQ